MRKLLVVLFLGLLIVPALAAPVLAVTNRQGTTIRVVAGETLNDDLIAAGNEIIIDGTVNGDVFVAANTIFINGTINGNLFAAGRTVAVNGVVTGSTLTAGQGIYVKGRITRNLVAAGETVILDSSGAIGQSWIGAADHLRHLGSVGWGMLVGGNDVEIGGSVGREVQAGTNTLRLTPTAVVGGPLTYWSKNVAQIAAEARVGPVTHKIPTERLHVQPGPWFLSSWRVALKLGGFLLVGLVALALSPGLRNAFPQVLVRKPWQAPLAGFLAIIALPVAAVILMLTVVGLPLGLVTLVGYPVLIYTSQAFVSWTAGRFLADRIEVLRQQSWPLVFILGTLVTTVLTELPVVGGLIAAAAVFYGLGGLYYAFVMRSEVN